MTNRIELRIAERGPFADGQGFGAAGAYERIRGRAHFAVDPQAPAQAGIVDLDKAPRDADGLVRFTSDFLLLAPVDPARASRRVFFDYGNRGNIRCLQFFNDAPASNDPRRAAHAGNGFLMRRGHALAFVGWQADVLPGDDRFLLDVPVAMERGRPVAGQVRVEYIADRPGVTVFPLSSRASTRSHPAVSLDTRRASLTMRRYATDARIPVPHDQWMFAQVEGGTGLDNQGGERGIVPSDRHIHLPAGFRPGWIYELVYEGHSPLVLGLGHVAVRDFVSFLKFEAHDAAGLANPLRERGGDVEKAYAWGRSQTGRCIRDMIHRGFNGDARGRRVFDGVLPHVSGAGLMAMSRFANLVVAAGQEHEDHFNPADRFPFTYGETRDHFTGAVDAICKRPATDPLVLHTQTATEYWQRRGSLVHTDTQGNDVPLPSNVRAYMWASSQHFADPRLGRPTRGICQNEVNAVWTSMFFRAMLDALDRWASDGTPPPESRIPRRADGTLVDVDAWRANFPRIPGVATPRGANALPRLDWGPQAAHGVLAEPPTVIPGEGYTVLVPAVDADGNDVAGVRAPMVQAPLATYTGWNLRARGFGEGAMHEFTGSTIPFPETPEHRAQTGDPRPSIKDRYGDAAGYVRAIEAAARRLVAERLMLEEDVARCVAAAADWHAPRHMVTVD
jgi:hypothetical protein